MNNPNFSNRQREAIEQMRAMKAKSVYQEPQKEENKTIGTQKPSRPIFEGLNLPFLDNLKTDSDLTLILGILLLLLSEKADKRLLFALIYILL